MFRNVDLITWLHTAGQISLCANKKKKKKKGEQLASTRISRDLFLCYPDELLSAGKKIIDGWIRKSERGAFLMEIQQH
jgi:hypothetical protein